MIDYAAISEAIGYYQSKGFNYLEVPWLVEWPAILITKPPHCRAIEMRAGYESKGLAVASAEQSFVQMMIDGNLPKGRFVACTPCYRDEHVEDEIHRFSFLKVELIDYMGDCSEDSVHAMATCAMGFFEEYLSVMVARVSLDADVHEMDIVHSIDGMELGSYGTRAFERDGKTHRWVYGTGLAEPRFSIARSIRMQDQMRKIVTL